MTEQTALVPSPNMWDIWKGKTQTYMTYDGRECTYNMQMLDAVLGTEYTNAPIPEKAAFLAYCINTQLDPLRKQVYFVKYSQSEPAAFVTNWEVFLDRAQRHPQFDGYEAGTIWLTRKGAEELGLIERGKPCDYVQDANHQIVGGWAKAYRKDRKHPSEVEVPLEEMIGKKHDGTPTKFWRTMLTTMTTKTPTARALRHSFPETLAGLYIEDETAAFTVAVAEPPLLSGDTVPPTDLDAILNAAAERAEEETIEATVEPIAIDKFPPAPGEAIDAEYTVDHQAAGDAAQREAAAGANGTSPKPEQPAGPNWGQYEAELLDASGVKQVDNILQAFIRRGASTADAERAAKMADTCKVEIRASRGSRSNDGKLFDTGPPKE